MKHIFIVSVDAQDSLSHKVVDNYVNMALIKYERVCKETRRVTHFDGAMDVKVGIQRVDFGEVSDDADDLVSVINRVNAIRTAWESLLGGKVERK